MRITVLGFGIVKDIFKSHSIQVELPMNSTVSDLKMLLEKKFPQLKKVSSCLIAVNNEYAALHTIIKPSDEIAIIPPVSGG